MSTFSDDPASFATHAAYVGRLRTAVKKVRTAPGTKFLYMAAKNLLQHGGEAKRGKG